MFLTGLSLRSGRLVIFDQRSGRPPIAERTEAAQAVSSGGRQVSVVWA